MPITPIRSVGDVGIIKDTSPVLLPPNGFSDGRNVRFNNGSVAKITGHQSILTTDVEPHFLTYWAYEDSYVYADATDIFKVNSANTSVSIKPADVTFTADGIWQGSLFNGGYTIVFNNTLDTPRFISGDDTAVAELPDWPTDYTAGILRPFQNALIAGNISIGGDTPAELPGSILVSSQAAPGAIPSSWTVGASLTTTADEFELAQTEPVLEIIDYRGTCFIFTGDSIHSLQLAQGSTPTRVQNLNYGNGCLATGCVQQFEGGLFVVDRNDIYTTSGSGDINSVSDHRMRDYFFDNLSPIHFVNTFVVRNISEDEMWVCYPTVNSEGDCDEALIWNYRENTWTIRDLPNIRSATTGPQPLDNTFDESREYLVFNGFRTSLEAREQIVAVSGTESNQSPTPAPGIFNWTLSGDANTILDALAEVQTATVTGDLVDIVDVQSFTLSGRSNVIDPALSEVVEFGIADNFSAGIANSIADTLDFTFSATDITGSSTAGVFFAPSAIDLDNFVQITGTPFTFTDTEELIDGLVTRYNTGAAITGAKIGIASKVGTDTFRITIFDQLFFTLPSGDNFLMIGGSLTITNGANSTVAITSSVFSDTITTSENVSILGWNIQNSTFTSGDAYFSGVVDVATFSITNTSENIPEISGTFTSGGDAAQARTDIKTALSADTEFSNAFTFTADTDIPAVDGILDYTFSTTAATVDFMLETGVGIFSNYQFEPSSNENTVFIAKSNVDVQISSLEDLVDELVTVYNASTSTNKIGTASKVGTDTFRLTVTEDSINIITEDVLWGALSTVSGEGETITVTMTVSSPRFSNTLSGSSSIGNGSQGNFRLDSTSIQSFLNGRQIGRAASYTAITAGVFEDFMFDIIGNGGTNTTPILFVSTQGEDQIDPSTMYTLTDGSNTQSVTFSSEVTSATDNDRATILSTIETAVDTNTETPINYTAEVNGDVVTLTAAEAGNSIGNWSLTIDNQNATSEKIGTLVATHANDTPGLTDTVNFVISNPLSSEDIGFSFAGSTTAAEMASSIRSMIIATGWTVSGTGDDIVFTSVALAPVDGLFDFSSDNDNISVAVVETTVGRDAVPASTYSLTSFVGDIVLTSGSLVSDADTDTIGAYIVAQPALEGTLTYVASTNTLTFTYLANGLVTRPVLAIDHTNGNGTFDDTPIGDNTSGVSPETTPPSIYTFTMPTGFAPTTVVATAADRTRTQTLAIIRDRINNITFSPVDINASLVGNILNLAWSGFTTPDVFSVVVDNQEGDGDITFGEVTEEDVSRLSTEIHAGDVTDSFNGETFSAFVERKVMDMGDLEATKWNGSVYPIMSGDLEMTIAAKGTVSAGVVTDLTDRKMTIPNFFNIQEHYKVDPRSNGRFFNIRFSSFTDGVWKLDGYSITTENADRR